MNSSTNTSRENACTVARTIIAAAALVVALWIPASSLAGEAAEQVCDVNADYYLGIEDYSDAVRLHAAIVRAHPDDALAHYHLGFALGMRGDRDAEVAEYLRAEALGLRNWDLFLNLGLAQYEQGDLAAAADSLEHAVLLGEDHPEAHYNLALVDEARGRLPEAEHETLLSLRLNPDQPAARTLLAVISARQDETTNIILTPNGSSSVGAADGETAAATSPPATAVIAILDQQ